MRLHAAVALMLAVLCCGPSLAAAEGERIHGENSSFAASGVVMAWGVLRGPTDEGTQVFLRLVSTDNAYAAVSVEGVDPFGGAKQTLFPQAPLVGGVTVRTSRATFAEVPQREIHLFRTGGDRPALTIYFQGLPDTTPEFDSEAALLRYVEDTVTRLSKGQP